MTRDGRLGVGVTAGSEPERVEAILPGVPVLDATEVARRSELVIVAVPHDQLEGLVAGLADVGAWQPGQLILHTDPAWGTGILAPAVAKGAIPLAVHPAIEFSGTSMDFRALTSAYAAVTAPAPVLPIAQALAVELGCEPIVVEESARPAYAEAITIAREFSRAIVQQATTLLAQAGVPHPGSYLSALVHTTVDRALSEAGSGPGIDPTATIQG
jgi:predicted short-subunit dehydrogenase-like oxidoreductase (DUF2520 family)